AQPYGVLTPPARFLGRRPADELRAMGVERARDILLQRGMQVVVEPRLVLRAREVAARLVDRERRIPRDFLLDHQVDDLVQLLGIGLRVELAGAAEAVDLVRVA